MGLMDGLPQINTQTSQMDKELAQLVSSLMTVNDLELKSEINNPLNLTRLKQFGRWAESEGMEGSKAIIDGWISDYLKYMVSHKREGRKEVVSAISQMAARMSRSLLGKNDEGL